MNQGSYLSFLVREMYPNDKHYYFMRLYALLLCVFRCIRLLKLTIDYFFQVKIVVWKGDETKDWSTFITGSVNGKAVENMDDLPEHPYITVVPEGGFLPGSLGDYLGFTICRC